ncbi:hypothetical protein E4U61_004914 [Claviceps capensis]|nr:hypothetical protein E4U61_004914 [Claviceps capensis]
MMPNDRKGFRDDGRVTALALVFLFLTPLFLIVRFWSRMGSRRGLGLDDLLILVSFGCTLVVQALVTVASNANLSKSPKHHVHDDKLQVLKLFYVAHIFANMTINLTKSSILLMYVRVFDRRRFRICCYVLLGIVVTYMLITVGLLIWQCSPIEGAWNKTLRATCVGLTGHSYANAGFSLATDVLILGLPVMPIWEREWPVGQKRALLLVFALGAFVTISSIMRATTLDFIPQNRKTINDLTPTLWTLSWTIVEENLAIICACLPMCRSVLAALAAPFVDASSPINNNGHNHNHNHNHNNITTTMTTGAIDAHGGSACGSCVYAMQTLPKEIMLFGSQDSRDWRPYTGPNTGGGHPSAAQCRAEDSINQVCIHASKTRPPGLESGGKIWITTHYEISYESLSHNEH